MATLPATSLTVVKIFSGTIREEKEMKETGQQEVKASLFTDHMNLYVKMSRNSTRRFLDMINAFSKVVKYKTNTRKSEAFLHINNGFARE